LGRLVGELVRRVITVLEVFRGRKWVVRQKLYLGHKGGGRLIAHGVERKVNEKIRDMKVFETCVEYTAGKGQTEGAFAKKVLE